MKQSEFTPEQAELAKKLEFKMTMHLNMDKGGELHHACEYKGLKLHRVVWTPKINGQWGTGKATFHIEGFKEEWTDVCEYLNKIISLTSMKIS